MIDFEDSRIIDSGETVIWIDSEGYYFGEVVKRDSKAKDGQIHVNYLKTMPLRLKGKYISYFRQETVCGHEWSYMLQNSKKKMYEVSLDELLQ